VIDSLSPKQRLALFWLLFVGEVTDKSTRKHRAPLQSEIKPELTPAQRKALVDSGLIRLEPVPKRRGKQVVLEDKAWAWASENLECELVASKHTSPALEGLQAVLHRLSGFLRARSLNLSDFFHEPVQLPPSSNPLRASVEDQIRRAYLDLSEGRLNQMIRLADLKRALPDIPTPAVDEALLAMQKRGDVSLQTIESMRQTTEEDRLASIRILGEDRNLVYLEK
jgi:hypothetical protein